MSSSVPVKSMPLAPDPATNIFLIMSQDELDSASMQIESQHPNTQGHQINHIGIYNIPNQSELRCHFKLRNIYMPRAEKIEPFVQRLTNHLGIRSKTAYIQLANCNNKEQLVDYAVGMLFDEDALEFYTNNTVFRVLNRDKKMHSIKPTYSQAFMRLITSRQVQQQQQQTYVPPLTQGELILKTTPSKKSIEERFSNSLLPIRLVSFPDQISQKDIKSVITDASEYRLVESDIPYHFILVRQEQARALINDGIEINGVQLLAFPDAQLGHLIASRQLKVCFNKTTSILSMLSVTNIFKKYGKLVYISELTQPNCFILFYLREPKIADIVSNLRDVQVEMVKEGEIVNPKSIKVKDKFYEVTRKRNN